MMKYAHCSWIGTAAPPKFHSAAAAAGIPAADPARTPGRRYELSTILPLWPDDADDRLDGQRHSAGLDDPYWAASPDWMARGACHGTDPELFFPISATGRSTPQIDAAKTICGQCVVSDDCLSYALRVMPDGIWGGTTREERIAMRLRVVRARMPAER